MSTKLTIEDFAFDSRAYQLYLDGKHPAFLPKKNSKIVALIAYFEGNKKSLSRKGITLQGVAYKDVQASLGYVTGTDIKKAGLKTSYVQLDNTTDFAYYLTK